MIKSSLLNQQTTASGGLLSVVESRVLMVAEVLRHHDQTLARKPGSGPTRRLCRTLRRPFGARAQRHGFRRYLEGLLLPAGRNKTLTALANTEPVAGAQRKEAQSLQWFLSESRWDPKEVKRLV